MRPKSGTPLNMLPLSFTSTRPPCLTAVVRTPRNRVSWRSMFHRIRVRVSCTQILCVLLLEMLSLHAQTNDDAEGCIGHFQYSICISSKTSNKTEANNSLHGHIFQCVKRLSDLLNPLVSDKCLNECLRLFFCVSETCCFREQNEGFS